MSFVGSHNIAEYAAQQLAKAAAYPRERLTTRKFRLPFLNVSARFTDPEFALMCEEGLATRGAGALTAKNDVEIFVMSADDGGWPAPAVWREPSFSPIDFERVITGRQLRGYYHHDSRFWQFFDAVTGRGLQSMLSAESLPPWETTSPLRAFLHWAYDGLGMRLTHAGSLGCEGRGVLLAGAGGSGKSGTTLAGIAGGLQSVGDDYVLLERECGSSWHAHALFTTMKQDEGGLQRAGLDPRQLGSGRPNWQNKIEFDPNEIGRGTLADRLEIVAILLPKIACRSRTILQPARTAEAMLALAPSGLFQMPGCTANGVRYFSDFVRDMPAYHLLLSEDPAEIADAIRGFVVKEGLSLAS